MEQVAEQIVEGQSVDQLRKRVLSVAQRIGVTPAAKVLNVSPSVVERFIAKLPQKAGSILMIEKFIANAESAALVAKKKR